MSIWTIDYLEKSGYLAYKYKRGSHMYHLNVETSDEDYGGVFICPPEMLEGFVATMWSRFPMRRVMWFTTSSEGGLNS